MTCDNHVVALTVAAIPAFNHGAQKGRTTRISSNTLSYAGRNHIGMVTPVARGCVALNNTTLTMCTIFRCLVHSSGRLTQKMKKATTKPRNNVPESRFCVCRR